MAESIELIQGAPAVDGKWREQIESAIDEVLGPIRRAPKQPALYNLPWFLFCGDSRADAARLLARLAESAPVAIQVESSAPDLWSWRFFGDCVGVALAPSIVENRHPVTAQAWPAMLELLRRKRPLLPLNGIVVTVAAAALAQPTRDLALRLRALVDGAVQALELVLPVYLVVTGMEAIPGFNQFAAALPEPCRAQAMGHRFPEAVMSGTEAAAAFRQAFQGVEARTRDLMLSLLNDVQPDVARGVFQFNHNFGLMRPNLERFAADLATDSALQPKLMWRGLYFTGTQGGPAFLTDLARRFLQNDRPLARH